MKPGYQTSEFWLTTIGVILSGGAASGTLPTQAGGNPGWVQLVGLIASAVLPLAYAWLRAKTKETEAALKTGPVSSTTPGGLKDPEISAQTAALTSALADVLAKWPKPAEPPKP